MRNDKKRSNPSRHKPPSRVTYERTHPVVSFRVSANLYQRLQELLKKTGKSIGDFFREALGVQQADTSRVYQAAYSEGHKEGYEEGHEDGYVEGEKAGWNSAKEDFLVTFPCSICGEIIPVNTAKVRKAASQYMVEHGWGHKECHEEQQCTRGTT